MHMHVGWRRILGAFFMTFGLIGALLYYAEIRLVQSFEPVLVEAEDRGEVIAPSLVKSTDPVAETTLPLDSQSGSGKIHLSTATQAELEELPGIGPSKAKAILDYRTQNGFQSVDDLDKVKGIGAVTLEKLRPLLEL